MASIYRATGRRRVAQAAGALAVVIAGLSLWALWPPHSPYRDWLPEIATFWTLCPPLWFYIEYAWVFDNWDDKEAVSRFKDLQGHAAKMWAGVLTLLTGAVILKASC